MTFVRRHFGERVPGAGRRARLALFGLLTLTLAGCSVVARPGEEETPPAGPDGAWAYVYRCPGDERFVARFEGDSVRLERELEEFALPLAISASGARYSDGRTTFWDRGGVARLETAADTVVGCTASAARTPWEVSALLGYHFRALGQEPGWMVEVAPGRRMHVLADYGAIEFYTDAPRVERGEGSVRYRAEGAGSRVVLTVRDGPCRDVMSGEPFPATAVLELNGRELQGCGRRLR